MIQIESISLMTIVTLNFSLSFIWWNNFFNKFYKNLFLFRKFTWSWSCVKSVNWKLFYSNKAHSAKYRPATSLTTSLKLSCTCTGKVGIKFIMRSWKYLSGAVVEYFLSYGFRISLIKNNLKLSLQMLCFYVEPFILFSVYLWWTLDKLIIAWKLFILCELKIICWKHFILKKQKTSLLLISISMKR